MSSNRFLLLQLADAAFPVGGFSHSAGLEAARAHGLGASSEALCLLLSETLCSAATASLAFVLATHDAGPTEALDRQYDVRVGSHIARHASRTQGRALIDTAARIWPETIARISKLPAPHLPLALGEVARALGVPRNETADLFLYQTCRALLSAAVRLGMVGPQEAQRMQFEASALCVELSARYSTASIEQAAQTSPLLELIGATHNRQYARLFQS